MKVELSPDELRRKEAWQKQELTIRYCDVMELAANAINLAAIGLALLTLSAAFEVLSEQKLSIHAVFAAIGWLMYIRFEKRTRHTPWPWQMM